MADRYQLADGIKLHVRNRITSSDAKRQTRTAREIIKRLHDRPGLILADEVGMGKTFVALAVAVSIAVMDARRRPVVIMVPPSLKEKWPNDFDLFHARCLSKKLQKKISYGRAERAVEFLKLLDDPIDRRKSILFVTHGAMSRGLSDKWMKLALIYQAVKHRWHGEELRKDLSRVLGDLLQMKWAEKKGQQIWIDLLHTPPSEWLRVLHRYGIDPEHDADPTTDDDPVPDAILKILPTLNTDDVYEELRRIPRRKTKYYEARLRATRRSINDHLRPLWEECLKHLSLKLPLLILDEAHHLKNPYTRLASLFHIPDAEADADEVSKGPLGGVFERMLFLTATPFQLGHAELCSVLERFEGIAWKRRGAPPSGLDGFRKTVRRLRDALDAAQTSAVALDSAWGLLRAEDLLPVVENKEDATGDPAEDVGDVESWWNSRNERTDLTPHARTVINRYDTTLTRMRAAERLLKPWVIRHLKPRHLPEKPDHDRRVRRNGDAILDYQESPDEERRDSEQKCKEKDQLEDQQSGGKGIDTGIAGIPVSENALLPFLLAARATSCAPDSRPVYAEGLSSSYEAFLHTRRRHREESETDARGIMDVEDDDIESYAVTDATRWYLDNLEELVPRGDAESSLSHPKISATVQRVLTIWEQREKCLVFCHFIATGKTLRQRISEAIEQRTWERAAEGLDCSYEEAAEEIEKLGKRFFDVDSPIREACNEATVELLRGFKSLREFQPQILDVVRRYVRTPTFLTRYFSLQGGRLTRESMTEALEEPDHSGLTLKQLLHDFFVFLENRHTRDERARYIQAVNSIQTGRIRGKDVMSIFSSEELAAESSDTLMPNVRLVNGSTLQTTRQRLMLTFNTPFYPEVLIASSVMAEGVDLHLNCRYVIHHDLCWNPSTLEQRTGRIDRIGAKVEQCGEPIHVFLPFISETQDEKMYRVVMDRERWFNVVMGEKYRVDAKTTEKLASRIPFPRSAAEELAFRLEVVKQR